MAVYCRGCGQSRDFPFSSMRTSRAPCQFCGGFDTTEAVNRRTKKPEVRNLPNYSYPDNLLPGTRSDVNTQAEREYDEAS